jgi:hypothetical protein
VLQNSLIASQLLFNQLRCSWVSCETPAMLMTTSTRETSSTHSHPDPKLPLRTFVTILPEINQFFYCLLIFIFCLRALANSSGSSKHLDRLMTSIQKVRLFCTDFAKLVEQFAYFWLAIYCWLNFFSFVRMSCFFLRSLTTFGLSILTQLSHSKKQFASHCFQSHGH